MALGIEHFHPIAVINQGASGGHDPALHAFDIVLGGKTFDVSSWISRQERRGADGRHIELLPSYYYDSGRKEEKQEIELAADSGLLEIAVAEAKSYRAGRIVVGKIASGNGWNRQLDRIRFMHNTNLK